MESKVAETLLQKEKYVELSGRKFYYRPASVATLVLVSEAVSRLPEHSMKKETMVSDVLGYAKHCRPLGDIGAILLLGAKESMRRVKVKERRKGMLGFLGFKESRETTMGAKLAEDLMTNLTPRDLNTLIATILADMQIGDFFGLTTFLAEVNLTKPTKVV